MLNRMLLIFVIIFTVGNLALILNLREDVQANTKWTSKLEQTNTALVGRYDEKILDLQEHFESLKMDADYLYQDILTNHATIKNLEGDITSGLNQLELRLSALSVELGALKDRLTELETVEIPEPPEVVEEPEIIEPYVVTNEVDKVVAEPLACPKPIKNRDFSYYIRNLTLNKAVSFRVIYDLQDGVVDNVAFENNPPSSVRRATVRYLNSLDFSEATAVNCSIPFKINI
tara:strand:- start:151 stop:843 length:693 start_codon:yes stop_codon:yes gene_type:complete